MGVRNRPQRDQYAEYFVSDFRKKMDKNVIFQLFELYNMAFSDFFRKISNSHFLFQSIIYSPHRQLFEVNSGPQNRETKWRNETKCGETKCGGDSITKNLKLWLKCPTVLSNSVKVLFRIFKHEKWKNKEKKLKIFNFFTWK